MEPDAFGNLAVRDERSSEHGTNVVPSHEVAGSVADLRLQATECHGREAPQGSVAGGGLAGVADPELDVVDALEGQEVGDPGVGVRVSPGTR